ncbi:alpha/beta hydrolase family protein [Saliphagus infecundisoli]|uniref:Alpha/beta hydrolase family protein n=1 Tax=Saliphagus infecundisoli TaxID=1849069 RepID=A0ABD5QGD7_9EURY|nr:alpha/beta hydrolase family protein [Saliphagus infecundisoli]
MDGSGFRLDRWSDRLVRESERRHAYDGEAVADWQRAFRADLIETLGLASREEVGVDTRRLGTIEREDHERQKWEIRTEPGFRLPFYLLVPAEGSPPYPVACTVHGHTPLGKELYVGRTETDEQRAHVKEERRDVGLQAVRRGYAALVPDMRGFGELAAPEDRHAGGRSCQPMQLRGQLVGRSLVGDRVWDLRRLLDFAESRPELDTERIAVTGNSGGGTVTLFSAAVDDRIDVAVPISYFCTFADSIGSIPHCACNYVPGILELGEMGDVAGLIAPRPFRAVHGREDDIFPVEATRRAFERLERIYDAAGAPENCQLRVRDGGHRYYPEAAWPFIDAHLRESPGQ